MRIGFRIQEGLGSESTSPYLLSEHGRTKRKITSLLDKIRQRNEILEWEIYRKYQNSNNYINERILQQVLQRGFF